MGDGFQAVEVNCIPSIIDVAQLVYLKFNTLILQTPFDRPYPILYSQENHIRRSVKRLKISFCLTNSFRKVFWYTRSAILSRSIAWLSVSSSS
ncbi:hypothetical protein IAS59_002373 [Cryptococcus gattii]